MFDAIQLNTKPIDDLLADLKGRIGDIAQGDALLDAGKRAAVRLQGKIPPYPPPSGKPLPVEHQRVYKSGPNKGQTYRSKFKTLRQQGKVHALVKEGKIPTKRTGTLGKSIIAIAQKRADGVYIIVGSNRFYAPLVIGTDEEQADYHKGVWWQLDGVVTQAVPDIQAGLLTDLTNYMLRGKM